jgi:S-methylmethionine-dependent homocysteine/selenocysteine methylase
MAAALAAAGRVPGADRVTLGAYANAFPPMRADAEANATVLEIRTDLDPARYAEFAAAWIAAGAAIVGGCCGIGPEHIAALRPLCDAA